MKFRVFQKKQDIIVLILFTLSLLVFIYFITTPVFLVDKVNLEKRILSSKDTLEKYVAHISNIKPGRDFNSIDALNKTAQYVKNTFSPYCDEVQIQPFKVKDNEYKNIICSFNTEGQERVIVGAHYDTFLDYPGADDNASGIAGILELARLIKENKVALNKRIDIVAYTLEEPPFLWTEDMGSFHHASSLRQDNINVTDVIILDMLGYYSDEKGSQKQPTFLFNPFYPSTGNYITVSGKFGSAGYTSKIKRYMKEALSMDVYSMSGFSFIPGGDISDHSSYWKNNYPAILITDMAMYRNPNYHKQTDTAETLDYKRMSDVVNGVYWTTLQVAK